MILVQPSLCLDSGTSLGSARPRVLTPRSQFQRYLMKRDSRTASRFTPASRATQSAMDRRKEMNFLVKPGLSHFNYGSATDSVASNTSRERNDDSNARPR